MQEWLRLDRGSFPFAPSSGAGSHRLLILHAVGRWASYVGSIPAAPWSAAMVSTTVSRK